MVAALNSRGSAAVQPALRVHRETCWHVVLVTQ